MASARHGDDGVSYRTAGGLSVTRLQPVVGAVIEGVDLCGPIAPEHARDIRQALLGHGVIFFRDQPISYENHLALGGIFGEVFDEGILEDRPALMVLESNAQSTNPAGGHWHSDGTYLEVAHAVSVLHAVRAAPLGGDTLFASAAAVYDDLPEEVKARIAPLRARASMTHIRRVKGLGAIDESASRIFAQLPRWVEHPVVRIHPDTGEEILFVNAFTTHFTNFHTPSNVRFGQDANPGAAMLLGYLVSQACIPEFQVRWRWKRNSVAIWDNRATQHYAVLDYPKCHRKMERAGIVGDRPF
jgi:taurine dioxygenase